MRRGKKGKKQGERRGRMERETGLGSTKVEGERCSMGQNTEESRKHGRIVEREGEGHNEGEGSNREEQVMKGKTGRGKRKKPV